MFALSNRIKAANILIKLYHACTGDEADTEQEKSPENPCLSFQNHAQTSIISCIPNLIYKKRKWNHPVAFVSNFLVDILTQFDTQNAGNLSRVSNLYIAQSRSHMP
jgi:hypothetical protein